MIIPIFHNSEQISDIIIRTDGDGLLLVIDSFDEFPITYLKFDSTFLYQILKRQVLAKSTVLITSRPGAWNQLLRGYSSEFVFDYSWQLLGFSPDQREQFIHAILKPEKAASCQLFLSTKPELDLLSLVPVNLSLITALVNSAVSLAGINTLTDVYTRLVVFTLDSELRRNDKTTLGILQLQDIPHDMMQIFNQLAEIAYNGTSIPSNHVSY